MYLIWIVSSYFLLFLPKIVLAQDTQVSDIPLIPDELVPCGDSGQDACQTCHIYELVENVFQWIFGISFVIVAIIIVVGGIRLATSGGNSQAKSDARKLIGTSIVGFILIGSAWVLVELLIATLSGVPDASGIFTSIQCVNLQPVQ